jgi:hypothetical protein
MSARFVHLHLHSEYSLADSTIRIAELVDRCVALEQPAVAVTDLNNLFALVKFYKAAEGKVNRNYENKACHEIDRALSDMGVKLIIVHPTDIDKSSLEHGSSLVEHYREFLNFNTELETYNCNYKTLDYIVENIRGEIINGNIQNW